MKDIFMNIITMSLTASILAIVVASLRPILKKTPKALVVAMWALVGIRLVCPIAPESKFSLLPDVEPMAQKLYEEQANPEETVWEVKDVVQPVHTVAEEASETSENIIGMGAPLASEVTEAKPTPAKAFREVDVISVGAAVWLAGMVGMFLYCCISYVRVYRKVREAAPLAGLENVRVCDCIDTPFLLGIFKPRIYLPSDVTEADRAYVLAHEQAHIKRLDYLWKPLGFVLLSVHWFNPVLWEAYVLLCRDIELACDEKVIRELGTASKKPYSTALINCSVPKRMISACPIAFGEVSVKRRVKTVLNYKKPGVWISVLAVLVCVCVGVCFLTNPKTDGVEEAFAGPVKQMLYFNYNTLFVSNLAKDSVVKFGSYEQSSIEHDGIEAVEWIVLELKDGKALLLSEKVLDVKSFEGNKSAAKEWLNGEFFETIFPEAYRDLVLEENGEKVVLLDKETLERYSTETVELAPESATWTTHAGLQRRNVDADSNPTEIRPAIWISLEKVTEKTADVVASVKEMMENYKYSYLSMGQYAQTRVNSSFEENDILWTVLDIQDGKALVISNEILDVQPFDTGDSPETVTWENCSLRKWLNDEFYSTAFSEFEKYTISGEEGSKMFLLAGEQALQYSRQPDMAWVGGYKVSATSFALRNTDIKSWDRVYRPVNGINYVYYSTESLCWYVIGEDGTCAYVDYMNMFAETIGEAEKERVGVRPAMWVDLNLE